MKLNLSLYYFLKKQWSGLFTIFVGEKCAFWKSGLISCPSWSRSLLCPKCKPDIGNFKTKTHIRYLFILYKNCPSIIIGPSSTQKSKESGRWCSHKINSGHGYKTFNWHALVNICHCITHTESSSKRVPFRCSTIYDHSINNDDNSNRVLLVAVSRTTTQTQNTAKRELLLNSSR